MDAFTTALTLLSRRELSAAQLRARLARRKFDPSEIDSVIERLRRDGTLDDRRVGLAAARLEGSIRHRGRRRVLQRLQQLGLDADIASAAVDEVFADIDEDALLDRAIDRRLKQPAGEPLDARATARLVRGLLAQGFDAAHVYARLRARGVLQ